MLPTRRPIPGLQSFHSLLCTLWLHLVRCRLPGNSQGLKTQENQSSVGTEQTSGEQILTAGAYAKLLPHPPWKVAPALLVPMLTEVDVTVPAAAVGTALNTDLLPTLFLCLPGENRHQDSTPGKKQRNQMGFSVKRDTIADTCTYSHNSYVRNICLTVNPATDEPNSITWGSHT